MTEPYEECHRYEVCSVNRCPLSRDYEKLKPHSKDPEQKCSMRKSARLRIGLKFNLTNKGLTPRELTYFKNTDSLPVPSKETPDLHTEKISKPLETPSLNEVQI